MLSDKEERAADRAERLADALVGKMLCPKCGLPWTWKEFTELDTTGIFPRVGVLCACGVKASVPLL